MPENDCQRSYPDNELFVVACCCKEVLARMAQLIIIGILFLAALGYLGYSIYKNFRADAGCSSGCSSCGIDLSKIRKELEDKGVR